MAKVTQDQIYQEVADRIIEQMKGGIISWRQTWKTNGIASFPRNAISGKTYRGVNVFLLMFSGFELPLWMTFNQARSLGGSVKKGEKGTRVYFWKASEYKDKNDLDDSGDPKTKKSLLMRSYVVFNISQCEGEKIEKKASDYRETMVDKLISHNSIDEAEKVAASYFGSSLCTLHEKASDSAFYTPIIDIVTMPLRGQFGAIESFYSTLFHEMTHSTGHESRLDRFKKQGQPTKFGSETYAQEELVAEFGAAFLCAMTGIDNEAAFGNSVAYLQNWIKVLKDDPRTLVFACQQAQKAADLILGFSPAEVETEEEEVEA